MLKIAKEGSKTKSRMGPNTIAMIPVKRAFHISLTYMEEMRFSVDNGTEKIHKLLMLPFDLELEQPSPVNQEIYAKPSCPTCTVSERHRSVEV